MGLLVLFGALSTQAEILILDDFESYSIGAIPTGDWDSIVQNDASILVTADESNSPEQSVEIIRPNDVGSVVLYQDHEPQAGLITYTAFLRTKNASRELITMSAKGSGSWEPGPHLSIGYRPGWMSYYEGSFWHNIIPIVDGKWYQVRIAVNVLAQTYDIYVDDMVTPRVSGADFWNNSVTSLNSIRFGAFKPEGVAPNAGDVAWVDDVLVEVDETTPPEPKESPDLVINKSVDNPSPFGDELVEFTIEVSNQGAGEAIGVFVHEKFPEDMEIPEGMAAFTSVGDYDTATGRWTVGDMDAGATEVLTIPAVIKTEPQPGCVINSVSAHAARDTNADNNSSSVAVRRPDIERCVDLSVEIAEWATFGYPCAGDGFVKYSIRVGNAGPDVARNVVLEISDSLHQVPGYSVLPTTNCEGLRCSWARLRAGESESVRVSTDRFEMHTPTTQDIKLVVFSDDEEYAPEDNSLTDQRTIPAVSQNCEGSDFEALGKSLGEGIGGGGGGCFIATAAYGTVMDERLDILRSFRDQILAPSAAGRAVIEWYYGVAPPIADYIAPRPVFRAMVRMLLVPILFALTYPLLLVVMLGLVIAVLLILRRRTSTA
jgi:hypothetical protein